MNFMPAISVTIYVRSIVQYIEECPTECGSVPLDGMVQYLG